MRSKERKQLLSALDRDLSILNDSITGKFAREKIALQEEWTQNTFEGPRDHILFLKYQDLVKTEYAAKLIKATKEIGDANYRVSPDDFGAIRDVYLAQFGTIYRVMQSEFPEVSDTTKLSLENFEKEMTDYIGGVLAMESSFSAAQKDNPAVKTAKRAVKLAWLAVIISVICLIPYIIQLFELLIASLSRA